MSHSIRSTRTRKPRPWERQQMTFPIMTQKFGHIMALDILMGVEKMAHLTIDAARQKMDKQKRLETALAELERYDFNGKLIEPEKGGKKKGK